MRCRSERFWCIVGAGWFSLSVGSCRVYGIDPGPAAAVFAATAVGASLVNREVTGDCLAVCSEGWHCDRESGLCVESSEVSGCGGDGQWLCPKDGKSEKRDAERESPITASDSSSPEVPSPTTVGTDANAFGLSCTLRVSKGSDNRRSLSLRLTNTGSTPAELRYFHPLSFALRAWVDGHLIPPRIPAIDMPVEPRTVRVEPGSAVDVATPVALSFGPGSRALDQSDPFRWWLDHEPARVRLEASRAFDSDPGLLCTGVLVP